MRSALRILLMLVLLSPVYLCRAQERAASRVQLSAPEVDSATMTVSARELRIPIKAAREFRKGVRVKESHPDEAVRHFQNAIQLYPSYTSAFAQLGLALIEKHQWQQAERYLLQVLAVDPKSAEAHEALGILLNRTGRFAESQAVLRGAVQLDPKSASAHYELGLSCWANHDYPCAEREARSAAELNPSFAGGRVLLGASLVHSNDTQAAIEQLKQALLLDPQGILSPATRMMLEKLKYERSAKLPK